MTLEASETAVDLPISERDHVRGPVDAPVTIVEYGEYECAHCGRAFHVLNELLEDMEGRFRLVFRHHAREEVHPFSIRAAEAAEAAGVQGRFWDMHDFLFRNQHQLEYEDLRGHARRIGLDVARFDRDMADHLHLPRVREHYSSGVRSGVEETPTFFVNGVRHVGSYESDVLRAAIEEAAR